MIGERIIDFLLEKNGKMGMNIAFLPYCFQMWDCMESVYQSAKEKGIGVGVFPIPYFNLKDGHIDEWHNEHELFEDVIDEDDLYDFNDFLRCSESIDYVVIHNAYDNGNTLTTIHPFFYTDKLKTWGMKLIFVPYGIFQGGQMLRQKGLINCDYIFVKDEEERETFLKTWNEIDIDMSDRCYAIGSPKFDALYKKYDMPFEWKKKVYKPMTLICTSVVPFMIDPERKFNQYKDTFWSELAKGRMVIFRPHPLMEATIKNRCPDLLEEWERFLEIVNEKAILDIDHELAESMCFATYMISDHSSVIELWKETGKPYEVME